MGIPDNAATGTENQAPLEQKLKEVIGKMTLDESTNTYTLPDDVPEELKLAAIAEKRRRDTQAALTKSRQELKKLEEVNKSLASKVLNSMTLTLSEQEKQDLDVLKFEDPDAWYQKMKELEVKSNELAQNQLNQVMTDAEKASEMARRQVLLEQFTAETGVQLTDDIIANDLPPKLVKNLESGNISFEDFLDKASKYLDTSVSATISKGEEIPKITNLNRVGGSDTPLDIKQDDLYKNYKNDVY